MSKDEMESAVLEMVKKQQARFDKYGPEVRTCVSMVLISAVEASMLILMQGGDSRDFVIDLCQTLTETDNACGLLATKVVKGGLHGRPERPA
jgi:hypothetical protein